MKPSNSQNIVKNRKILALAVFLTQVLLGIGAAVHLSQTAVPGTAVSDVQYQSLAFTINSAMVAHETGHYLIVDRGSDPPVRFEDVAVDDVGFTLLVSAALRHGFLDLSEETRAFFSQRWSLLESREYMATKLVEDLQNFNRLLYLLLTTVCSLVLLLLSISVAHMWKPWATLFSLSVALGLSAITIPHIFPSIFVFRMHVHGLIAALTVLGLCVLLSLYVLLTYGNMSLLSNSMSPTSKRITLLATGGVAGVLLHGVVIMRRSQGLIWLLLVTGVIGWWFITETNIRKRPIRSSATLLTLVAIGLAIGWGLVGWAANAVINDRETNIVLAGEIQEAYHPTFHALLIGISRSPKNNLGVRSEADVVEFVQRTAGIEGDAFSTEYNPAAERIYWNYLKSNPMNYLVVLWDNVDRSIVSVFVQLGISPSESVVARQLYIVFVGFLLVIALSLTSSYPVYRAVIVVLFIYMSLAFVLVISTTGAASNGPASALILLAVVCIGGVVLRVVEFLGLVAVLPDEGDVCPLEDPTLSSSKMFQVLKRDVGMP